MRWARILANRSDSRRIRIIIDAEGLVAALRYVVNSSVGTPMREERYIRRLAKIKALEDRAGRE